MQEREATKQVEAEHRVLSRNLQRALDMGPKTREDFLRHLKRKCGSIPRAWREIMDPQHNGRLNERSFYDAARRVGYFNSLHTLWRELDKDRSGFIEMQELDPEADKLISAYKEALLSRYGSLISAFEDTALHFS